jgi:hypothetical protein
MNEMSNDDWQPLTEIWDTYSESLDNAIANGFMEDDQLSEKYVWPGALNFGDAEQADMKRYVHERMTEIVDRIKTQGGVDPNLIAGYIFRSVICGCMWEKDRIGK